MKLLRAMFATLSHMTVTCPVRVTMTQHNFGHITYASLRRHAWCNVRYIYSSTWAAYMYPFLTPPPTTTPTPHYFCCFIHISTHSTCIASCSTWWNRTYITSHLELNTKSLTIQSRSMRTRASPPQYQRRQTMILAIVTMNIDSYSLLQLKQHSHHRIQFYDSPASAITATTLRWECYSLWCHYSEAR